MISLDIRKLNLVKEKSGKKTIQPNKSHSEKYYLKTLYPITIMKTDIHILVERG